MQNGDGGARSDQDRGAGKGGETRPQRGGEAGTTRFGMEDGDNTDVPATGGPPSDDEAADDAS